MPALFLYSMAINILIMAGPLFMLQVYDRVLPSQSIPTLGGLFVLVVVLFTFLALFEYIRSRIVTRLALYVDRRANSSGMSSNLLRGIGANSGHLIGFRNTRKKLDRSRQRAQVSVFKQAGFLKCKARLCLRDDKMYETYENTGSTDGCSPEVSECFLL